MHNIKKLKVWTTLKAMDFVMVTYRFCDTITGYGAMYTNEQGHVMINISPYSQERAYRWLIHIDKSLISPFGAFTLNQSHCTSSNILRLINDLKNGKVEMETNYVEGKGRMPVYGKSWPN